jgi:putative aldouronate transport system substrate-binding protein
LGNVTRGTFAVTKNCREPERLVAWVNTLYTEAGGILMQVGQENEEYFWNEDGKWEWMADVNTVANSILPDATISEGGAVPGLFTADFQEKYDDSSTAFLVGEMRRIRQWTVMPFPLVTLSREDEARIGELHGAIAPFAEARMAAFVTGDTPLNDETWQAFCEGVRQRGIEEEIALWQKYAR